MGRIFWRVTYGSAIALIAAAEVSRTWGTEKSTHPQPSSAGGCDSCCVSAAADVAPLIVVAAEDIADDRFEGLLDEMLDGETDHLASRISLAGKALRQQ